MNDLPAMPHCDVPVECAGELHSLGTLGERMPYKDQDEAPRPRRRLWRTLFKKQRPIRRFAPRIDFAPQNHELDPAIAAQWGENLLIEDYLLVLHRDGTTSSWRHVVTQLHSGRALAEWDEVVRNHDAHTQNLQVLQARIFLPDGTSHGATSNLRTFSVPSRQPNTHGRSRQLFFAPLRPGVILEFEERFDDFKVDPFCPGIWESFYLQTASPCRHRRFTVAVAAPFELRYAMHHGAPAPRERSEGGYQVYAWEAKDCVGTPYDDWAPPLRDFAPWVDVSTTRSWAPFAMNYRDDIVPKTAVPPDIKKLADSLTKEKPEPLEQAAALYTYACRTVRYGRPPLESEVRNARDSSSIFRDLRGDCKDKSALLVQLLRAKGVEAYVAIVLTSNVGRTPFLQSPRFNHAIVKMVLEDKTYWLDPAAGEFAFGDLPAFDQDIFALVLDKDAYFFDHVAPPSEDHFLELREWQGRLDSQGDYQGSFQGHFTGDVGAHLRSQLLDRTQDHQSMVLQTWFGSDYEGAVGSDFSFKPFEELAGSADYRCSANLPLVARRVKNIVLVNIPWANRLVFSGPMAAEQRRIPLSLPAAHNVAESYRIELPSNVKPLAIPEPVRVTCEWGEYSCSWQTTENSLHCERKFRLAGQLVAAEDFPAFKSFWRQASQADSTPLVLEDLG